MNYAHLVIDQCILHIWQCWSFTERRSTCVWTCATRASLKVTIAMLMFIQCCTYLIAPGDDHHIHPLHPSPHSTTVLHPSKIISFMFFEFHIFLFYNLRIWKRLEQAGSSLALKRRRALRSKWFYYRQAFSFSKYLLITLFSSGCWGPGKQKRMDLKRNNQSTKTDLFYVQFLTNQCLSNE